MLPPVSLPMAKPTSPAAVAAPGPALEPDEPSSSSQGFIVWPPNQMSFNASAPMLSLATSTAPAALSRSTTALFFRGNAVAIGLCAIGGGNARGVEQVLSAPWNAVQRAAIVACCDFRVGLACLLKRVVARQGDDAAELRIESFEAVQVNLGQPFGGELAALDPARKLRDGCKGDVAFVRGQGEMRVQRCEAIRLESAWSAMPGKRDSMGGRRQRGFKRELARSSAAFVDGRHLHAPVARRLREVGLLHLDLHEFFGFGEGGRGDLRADRGSGAEGGWRSGRMLVRSRRSLGGMRHGGSQQASGRATRNSLRVVTSCLSGST